MIGFVVLSLPHGTKLDSKAVALRRLAVLKKCEDIVLAFPDHLSCLAELRGVRGNIHPGDVPCGGVMVMEGVDRMQNMLFVDFPERRNDLFPCLHRIRSLDVFSGSDDLPRGIELDEPKLRKDPEAPLSLGFRDPELARDRLQIRFLVFEGEDRSHGVDVPLVDAIEFFWCESLGLVLRRRRLSLI